MKRYLELTGELSVLREKGVAGVGAVVRVPVDHLGQLTESAGLTVRLGCEARQRLDAASLPGSMVATRLDPPLDQFEHHRGLPRTGSPVGHGVLRGAGAPPQWPAWRPHRKHRCMH